MSDTTILVLIAVTSLFLAVINILALKDTGFKKQLALQNQIISFENNHNINIKEDCFQPESFFKLHDNCSKVENSGEYTYIKYHTQQDLYM